MQTSTDPTEKWGAAAGRPAAAEDVCALCGEHFRLLGEVRNLCGVAWRNRHITPLAYPSEYAHDKCNGRMRCAASKACRAAPAASTREAGPRRRSQARCPPSPPPLRLLSLDPASYRAPAAAGAAPACSKQSEARSAEARRAQQRRAVPGTLRAASSRRRARAAGRARVASSLMHYSRRRCSRRPGTCWMACGLPCSGRRSVVGLSPRVRCAALCWGAHRGWLPVQLEAPFRRRTHRARQERVRRAARRRGARREGGGGSPHELS